MSEEKKATDKKEPSKAKTEAKGEVYVKVRIGSENLEHKGGLYARHSEQTFLQEDAKFYEEKNQLAIVGLA